MEWLRDLGGRCAVGPAPIATVVSVERFMPREIAWLLAFRMACNGEVGALSRLLSDLLLRRLSDEEYGLGSLLLPALLL